MAIKAPTATAPANDPAVNEKINQLRELFADAPAVGKTALEKDLSRLTSDASKAPPPPVESAGRAGSRLGKVSELTIIVPFAPGGAQRLRAFLRGTKAAEEALHYVARSARRSTSLARGATSFPICPLDQSAILLQAHATPRS
jgi:hypothetical protein